VAGQPRLPRKNEPKRAGGGEVVGEHSREPLGVTARNNTTGSYRGHPIPEAARATLVLVRDAGQWQLTAAHMSFIAGTRGRTTHPRSRRPARKSRERSLRRMTMTAGAAAMGEELARSIHPEKVFAFLPGMSAANLAALYGLDESAYAAIRDRFAAQTAAAARDLLGEPEFATAVDRLPLSAGETLAVVGESTTDAADSWLEIFGHLITLRRPADAIKLVNMAISGYPTTMLLRVMSETLQRHRPDWIAIFAGGNDVLRYGTGSTKPIVSGTETAKNLAEMRRQAAAASARTIWMTPTARDTERIAAYPPFQAQQIWLDDDDARAVDVAVRETAGDGDVVVDLSDAFGSPLDAALLSADGLHPTLAGQKAIARRFVERLAGSRAPE
jgi:acyl-CoA thioesterase-1